MKYVFFGSPEFAAIILQKLLDAGMPPVAVVCNPDRPFGRKKLLAPPPVKRLIAERKSQSAILQPEHLDESFRFQVLNFKPDFFIVAAYARIIPKSILAIPRLGSIGTHPSLLPKYRGATPIQSAILSGERETGTTLFLLDAQVDHGPIIAQATMTMTDDDDYTTVIAKLGALSGDLLVETLPRFVAGGVTPQPQDESAATHTKKFSTEDGFVDLAKDNPQLVRRKIRALNPDPGVYTFVTRGDKKIRVKLLAAALEEGKLKLLSVQPEGKKPTGDARAYGL